MSEVVAIGAGSQVRGFVLAGARVCLAETPEAVREAWAALPDSVGFVILTPAAAAALEESPDRARPVGAGGRFTVVTPQ
jgi:vacuolar-type H+-ATPase subunit F/Vma7